MKDYLVSAEEMRAYDHNTIEHFFISSEVLMERAALAVIEELEKRAKLPASVLVIAGTGNNGGDGAAVGRLLKQKGCETAILLAGEREHCTRETRRQLQSAEKYGCLMLSNFPNREYDIIIDALFGIGLSRDVTGERAILIQKMNESRAYCCAVDLCSGVDSDTGKIRGSGVNADLTVTFAFRKRGHIFYPGRELTGELVVKEIGITEESFLGRKPSCYTFRGAPYQYLPERSPGGNKGSFGKLLVLAGSPGMCGASLLAVKAAYRIGAGMVKALVPEENREIIQTALPEVLVRTYTDKKLEGLPQMLQEELEWADAVAAGPGLSAGRCAEALIRLLLQKSELPMVLDADGLNLIAKYAELRELLREKKTPVILTPHLKEFARLQNITITEAAEDTPVRVQTLARELHATVVCKDAATIVAEDGKESWYLNSSGNDGMATAGSGDVLAGMIGGLLAQGMTAPCAARNGVYLHGIAGDLLAARIGKYSMMAGDLIEEIQFLNSKGKREHGEISERLCKN